MSGISSRKFLRLGGIALKSLLVMIDALRIPQEYCMDKGQGYDNNNWLHQSNLSQHLM